MVLHRTHRKPIIALIVVNSAITCEEYNTYHLTPLTRARRLPLRPKGQRMVGTQGSHCPRYCLRRIEIYHYVYEKKTTPSYSTDICSTTRKMLRVRTALIVPWHYWNPSLHAENTKPSYSVDIHSTPRKRHRARTAFIARFVLKSRQITWRMGQFITFRSKTPTNTMTAATNQRQETLTPHLLHLNNSKDLRHCI